MGEEHHSAQLDQSENVAPMDAGLGHGMNNNAVNNRQISAQPVNNGPLNAGRINNNTMNNSMSNNMNNNMNGPMGSQIPRQSMSGPMMNRQSMSGQGMNSSAMSGDEDAPGNDDGRSNSMFSSSGYEGQVP